MRISTCLTPLVMSTMISRPFDDIVLEGQHVGDGQKVSEWPLGFVGLVGPKPMRPRRHAQSGKHVDEDVEEDGLIERFGEAKVEAVDSDQMKGHVEGNV